jgi:hypothetical protein
MWERQRLATLWASTACHRDSLTLFLTWPSVLAKETVPTGWSRWQCGGAGRCTRPCHTTAAFAFHCLQTLLEPGERSYGLDDRGVGVRVPIGSRKFSMSSRLALGSTQPPIQRVPGTLSPGVKRPVREADHSPPVRRPRGLSSSPDKVKEILFSTSSRPALGFTKPLIQWVPGTLSPGVKRAGREADHSPPASAEVKKMWIYTSTPPYAFMT